MADTAFLPKKVNRLFSKNHNPERIKRCRFRRNVLDRLILSLADQQLVTGFSLMLTGWIVYHDALDGAHFALIVYLSCLSSTSHLAAIVTLRKFFEQNQALALFRITIISLFAVLLSVSITLTSAFGPFCCCDGQNLRKPLCPAGSCNVALGHAYTLDLLDGDMADRAGTARSFSSLAETCGMAFGQTCRAWSMLVVYPEKLA